MEIKETLFRVLSKLDLSDTTPKQIRAKLEKKLNLAPGALEDRKDEIKALINEFVSRKTDTPTEDPAVVELRKTASTLKVPPTFWKSIDKADYKTSLEAHLIDFALAKKIVDERRLPTVEEVKNFKKKRERDADLEGLSSENIISGKRRRTADLFPL